MDERKTVWLLVAVLVSQLVLLASQVTAEGGERSQLEAFGLRLTAPVARLGRGSLGLFGNLREHMRTRGHLMRENQELQSEVESLRLELTRLHDLDKEAARLAEAVGFSRQQRGDLRVAEIVFLDTTSWLRNMIIYAGSTELEVNQPVMSPDGLVGRIILVTGPYARVQLLTDSAASVSAMVERTRRQALAQGSGAGGLELVYMPLQADVREGDLVVTAGIDGVYPRGIPIARITRVEPGNELFHRIELEPVVNLRQLERVYTLDRASLPEQMEGPLEGPADVANP